MNDSACQHWIALSDRAALGEPLTPHELRFQQEHEARCVNCRSEGAVWARLGQVREEGAALSEAPVWGEVASDGAFAQREARSALARRWAIRSRRGRALAWAALVVASAAAALLVVRKAAPPTAQQGRATRVGFVVVSGEVDVASRPASAGLELHRSERVRVGAGRACLAFEPSVTACLAGASEAELSSTEPKRRALALRAGHVLAKLDPQPPGTTFRIETPRGAAIAKGTVFAVEVSADHSVLLRVHEGTVLWQGIDGHEQSFPAPSEARFANTRQFGALTPPSAERDEALIRLSGLLSTESKCRLDVTATPQGSRVLLDGSELGPAPVSALVSGGRRLSVEHPGYAARSERLWLSGSAHVSRNYQLLASPTAAASPSAAAPASETAVVESAALPRASELLARARSLRAAGRSADAASAYRRLSSAYPRSDEARASLVSLAELLLSELGDPAGALRTFDSYLRAPGALTPEARYGRIRALGRLGRHVDERAAIEQFLLDYPRSVQAANLKAKLTSLR